MARTLIVAALIALAWADLRAEEVASARAAMAAHRAAAARAAHRARTPPAAVPGPPPGPGYCWHYLDRGTQAPGFWDMCRER